MADSAKNKPLISTREEFRRIHDRTGSLSSSHRLAFSDFDFLLREELRPVRLQLELLKPELILRDHHIHSTIVFFGSARIPKETEAREQLTLAKEALGNNPHDAALKRRVKIAENVLENSLFLVEATKLARIISEEYGVLPGCDFVVTTGGGPSFMEAANRGAYEANARSITFNITLPHEQFPNRYVNPELTFQFHYFAIRKMHFLIRAAALIAFPGGFGTCDELFDALTLIQTHKMRRIPIILFSKRYWNRVINFDAMLEEGMIDEEDRKLMYYVETAEEAWSIILDFYHLS